MYVFTDRYIAPSGLFRISSITNLDTKESELNFIDQASVYAERRANTNQFKPLTRENTNSLLSYLDTCMVMVPCIRILKKYLKRVIEYDLVTCDKKKRKLKSLVRG